MWGELIMCVHSICKVMKGGSLGRYLHGVECRLLFLFLELLLISASFSGDDMLFPLRCSDAASSCLLHVASIMSVF